MANKLLSAEKKPEELKSLFTTDMESGNWMSSKKDELQSTKKMGILGEDSEKYKNVLIYLENINSILDTNLSGEIKKNDKGEMGNAQLDTMLPLVYNLYRALIDTCDRYMEGKEGNKRSPRTKTGKERIRIVEEIKLFAEKDINVLMSGNLQGVDLGSKTLREAIANARTRVINLKKPDEEHTHVGGQMGYLTVLDSDENDGKVGYYSDMKIIEKGKEIEKVEMYLNMADQRCDVPKEKKEVVLNYIKHNLGNVDIFNSNMDMIKRILQFFKSEDEEVMQFCEEVRKVAVTSTGLIGNFYGERKGNMTSETSNLNARNVASSRMAKLFGKENLIAKSEMVELNEDGKDKRYGSVMEQAEGVEAAKYRDNLLISYIENHMDTDYKQGIAEMRTQIKRMVTGEFQKEMADLQVVDFICGQIDRHAGNFFINMKDGKWGKVTGIDNDTSFMNAQMDETGKSAEIALNGLTVITPNNELAIPHMSRELAINILLINPDVIRYSLVDLIEKPEVEAVCERLERVKTAVRKELEKPNESSKLVDKDEDWNEETLDDFMGGTEANYENIKTAKRNYVGRYMETSILDNYRRIKIELEKMKK